MGFEELGDRKEEERIVEGLKGTEMNPETSLNKT